MVKLRLIVFVVLVLAVFSNSPMAQESGEKKPAEALLAEQGGVLLPKGALVLEPSIKYSHFSRHRIAISGFSILEAIVIGRIEVRDVKRDILQFSLTGRYGLTNRLELEAEVPYLFVHYRDLRRAEGDGGPYKVSDNDIGDVEGGIYYHLIREKGWVPDIVVNLRVKAPTGKDPYEVEREGNRLKELPTGNGHWGLSGGFTMVKASDPAVFFAGLNYQWNIERDVGKGYGKIDPGDSVEYSLGMAYALSERFSLSTSFQQRITFETEQNGKEDPETYMNVASVNFGLNYSLSKTAGLNINVGIGLTEDSPDFEVTVSVPLRVF
ncbi:MAG: hypothetical protein DRG31_03920 [Deltaproteobacteria bacterium]|nr:MAG: hypothetical protein DRG31_03920 [Deltaproteobacteria bacterium]